MRGKVRRVPVSLGLVVEAAPCDDTDVDRSTVAGFVAHDGLAGRLGCRGATGDLSPSPASFPPSLSSLPFPFSLPALPLGLPLPPLRLPATLSRSSFVLPDTPLPNDGLFECPTFLTLLCSPIPSPLRAIELAVLDVLEELTEDNELAERVEKPETPTTPPSANLMTYPALSTAEGTEGGMAAG